MLINSGVDRTRLSEIGSPDCIGQKFSVDTLAERSIVEVIVKTATIKVGLANFYENLVP